KEEYNRRASILMPHLTTTTFGALPKSLGTQLWSAGWPVAWKFGDQHVFSDRLMIDVAFSHFCSCYQFAVPEPGLETVQPMFEISSGAAERSTTSSSSQSFRNRTNATANYFMPGKWGGDHSIKAGFEYVNMANRGAGHTGGNVTARFSSGASLP